MWNVVFFSEKKNKSRVLDFIESCPDPVVAKVAHHLELLKDYGLELRIPHVKKVHFRLYELRIMGKMKVRLIFCVWRGQFVILHGFIKKSSKIPTKELKTALDRINKLI